MEFIYPQATSLGKNMNITNKWSNIMIIKSTKFSVPGKFDVRKTRFQSMFPLLHNIPYKKFDFTTTKV